MVKPERVFRTRFEEKTCPKCKLKITPVSNGQSSDMHGFRIYCPECKCYIGWGGKVFADHFDTAGQL